MGIFDRMADIAKANMNDLLDHMEDPEKMLKNMIIEMEEALTKATSSLAKAMANEEHLRKQRQNAQEQAEQWEAKAALALQASQNDLVKEALTKKMAFDGQRKHYDEMLAQASQTTQTLRSQLDALKAKVDEARMKQSTLAARAQAAKTQKEFATALDSATGDGAFAKFEKMEQKVEGLEAEARAFSEISGSVPQNDPFAALEKDRQLEEELAKLQAKMSPGGGTGA